jgi:predicted ATPase/DNA-binding CsgD family transcriptional regulator
MVNPNRASRSTAGLAESLTERERAILACLADGQSNQEIANQLHLAEKTVRWYNSQIYSKLGVSSRQAAVEQAQALGLLGVESTSPAGAGKHNLPAQATPFVGRRQELSEIAALLNDGHTRLITILAPGGMGKTRLALEVARRQIGRYADGVIFVPLAPLSAAADIVTTTAEQIGFSFYGDQPPGQQLTDFLRRRSLLLVLDNFEHVLDGAPLAADWLQAAPGLRVLATSRERLNLLGETVYTLRGLDFPAWETPTDALEFDAVQLFMHSARRTRPDFELQAHDLDHLARICRLTAGMPLAIELAAGWIDVLALEQIAAEIQGGIDILETDLRDVPERHRSVRATFDYTWGRLSADEQQMFMRLAVFRGGFTREAAQAVAGADARALRKLANKALVQVSPDDRHDIHELLRQFGAEKLAASGEQPQLQTRHAAFFADFMAERKHDIRTDRQLEALEQLDPDFENVRSAWLHTINQGDWQQLPKFLHSLWFYLDVRTRGQEGVELLEYAARALHAAPSTPATELARGRVLARLGWFQNDTGFSEKGADTCDEAIRLLRQHDSPEDLIAALYSRELAALFLKQTAVAANVAREGLGIARAIGDTSWEGHLLVWSSFPSLNPDDLAAALQFAQDGLAVFEALGDRWGISRAYPLLGEIKEIQGDYETARHWYQRALTLTEAFGHAYSIAKMHISQARLALYERDVAAARSHLRQALRVFWDAGYLWVTPFALVYIAQLFADQQQLDKAVEILAAVGQPSSYYLIEAVAQALRDELEAALEPERFAAAWARGQSRDLSAVVAELLVELEGE